MAVSAIDVLTRVKYVGQDFDTYLQEITEFLQMYYPEDYNDYVNNNLGMALLQIIAYTGQNLAFYLNQRTTNLYITQSHSQTAIAYAARMLNYDIRPAMSNGCEVTIRLTDGPYSFPISIKKGFRFSAERGLIYEYRGDNDVIFSPGDMEKTIFLKEGKTLQNIFISSGLENQTFSLAGIDSDSYPELNSFEVVVDTAVWEEQRRITFDELPIYEINYFTVPPTIKFGDGIAGLIPPVDSQITVSFVSTKGIQGEIAQNGILSTIDQIIVGSVLIPIEVVSSTYSSGGQDPQDLREVKSKAPEFFQSQDRAITKRDYNGIVNSYPGIAKADAQIIRGIEQDITLNNLLDDIIDSVSGVDYETHDQVILKVSALRNYLSTVISDTCRSNTVQVSVLGKNMNNLYQNVSDDLKKEIKEYLEDRNDIVHSVTVVDGMSNVILVNIEIELSISANAVDDDVIELVRLSLVKSDSAPYGELILRDYGESLYLSDLYNVVKESQVRESDIEYCNIKILGPIEKLDSDGNLIISKNNQEIIQPGDINIKIIPKNIFL